MIIKSKTKKAKSKPTKGSLRLSKSKVVTPGEAKLFSKYEQEIISELHKAALNVKPELRNRLQKTEISLEDINYPKICEAKMKILDKLKKERVVKSYTTKKEEFESFPQKPSELEMEDNPEIIFSPEYITDDYDYCTIVKAAITFYPQKVTDYYKKIEWEIREQTLIQKGLLLTCDGLKFDSSSGKASYGKIKKIFRKDKKIYKLLKHFLENPNKEFGKDELFKIISQKRCPGPYQQNVKNTVNNIRKKLKMSGKDKENEDLFEKTDVGYKLKCKK